MDDIMTSLSKVSARLSEESFLTNKGLSNEVGIHVFCYDPRDELTVRAYFENLKSQTGAPYRLIERDLHQQIHIGRSLGKREMIDIRSTPRNLHLLDRPRLQRAVEAKNNES